MFVVMILMMIKPKGVDCMLLICGNTENGTIK